MKKVELVDKFTLKQLIADLSNLDHKSVCHMRYDYMEFVGIQLVPKGTKNTILINVSPAVLPKTWSK